MGCSLSRTCCRKSSDREREREKAPPPKDLHFKKSEIQWPKTIVTDARDVYEKNSTKKGGLLPGNRNNSRMAGNFGLSDPLDRGRTHDYDRSDGHEESRRHFARIPQYGDWSVQKDSTLVRSCGPRALVREALLSFEWWNYLFLKRLLRSVDVFWLGPRLPVFFFPSDWNVVGVVFRVARVVACINIWNVANEGSAT